MPRLLTKPWLESYLDYVKNTENPHNYNLWCGISAIASSLKRRVYIWRNMIQFFPNQYVILVGPPGIGKGSAIKPAVNLVKQADTANYLSDRITAERIVEKLAAGFSAMKVQAGTVTPTMEHSATILAKELPVFLGSSDWMHSLLCQLWDENEFDYETKHKGSHIIKNLCVSLLGGCVPEYIRSLTRDALAPVTGGFTARCIFVYATDKSKLVPWDSPNGSLTKIEGNLINDLQHIASLAGEMKMSPNAANLWDKFYNVAAKVDQFESDALSNFKSRIPSHVIKLMMCLSISESDSLVIEEKHLKKAISLIEDIRDKVDVTFRAVGESPLAAAQDRVMRFLEVKGIASRTEILRYNHKHITDEQLTSILYVLESIGFCQMETKGKQMFYKCVSGVGP